MKNNVLKTGLFLALVVVLSSFTAMTKKDVNISESTINWTGHKVTGQHEGTIQLQEGQLHFDGKTLVGGNFVMDMTTINTTDLEGEWKGKLDGHLKSDDFFGVANHKTATLKFTKVTGKGSNYKVDADLTIKGITNPISFNLEVLDGTAVTKLKIDRTKYNIKYGSASFFDGLKDKAISNEFDLKVSLKF